MDKYLVRPQWNNISDPQSVIRNNASIGNEYNGYQTGQNMGNKFEGNLMSSKMSSNIQHVGIQDGYHNIMQQPPMQFEQCFVPVYDGNYDGNRFDENNNRQGNVYRAMVPGNSTGNMMQMQPNQGYIGNRVNYSHNQRQMVDISNGASAQYAPQRQNMRQMQQEMPQPVYQTSMNKNDDDTMILPKVQPIKKASQPMKMSLDNIAPKRAAANVEKTIEKRSKPNKKGTITASEEKENDPIMTPDNEQSGKKFALDRYKNSNNVGLRVFTGSVDKIMKWYKTLQASDVECLFEVIGKCVSVRCGRGCERQLLVRDVSGGPVLQVAFYEIDFLMSEVNGEVVRIIGKMIGCNKLQAYKVRKVFGTEVLSLPRLSAIGQHIVTKIVKETQK